MVSESRNPAANNAEEPTFHISQPVETDGDSTIDLWDELDLDEQLKAIPLNAEALADQEKERQNQEREVQRELERAQRELEREEQLKIDQLLREKFKSIVQPEPEPEAETIVPTPNPKNRKSKSSTEPGTKNTNTKGFQARSKRRNGKKR